ncbi:large conductance mechanosensitive channel protein MscL [Planosporangium flavigriseum]|uniref:Large-conductance mechanosensitive channel n=1 Tax=Planosporangium flavigriseum TaxID=373681 RepID=A0A8J3M0B5_9ACTN|nr:large conductance mechanosensitive channel protein MscL [Planosporangium flavigriseum]NJC63967.1 large conductance mechanosensitive channel protein MscL [Planosporangium flavigriseum]GIG76746.1 large-conductance mechanosensitive channel [Planosporangium flavigriseum]
MLRGFKDFVMRGNVVDLAVGVVIGAAFTTLVTTFTKSFLEPLIRLITGGTGQMKGQFKIAGEPFDYAAFINATITFLLTAATLYFLVVLPMNKLAERRARGHEPRPKAPSEEILLLREIRDALAGPRPEVAHADDRR